MSTDFLLTEKKCPKIFQVINDNNFIVHEKQRAASTPQVWDQIIVKLRQGSARIGKGWPIRQKALKLKTLA